MMATESGSGVEKSMTPGILRAKRKEAKGKFWRWRPLTESRKVHGSKKQRNSSVSDFNDLLSNPNTQLPNI